MLDEMPPGLLEEWTHYHAAEPFGQDWLRGAITSREVSALSAIVQAIGGAKDIRWPKLDDFLPGKPKPDQKQLTAQQAQTTRIEREQAGFRVWKQ